MTRLIRILIFIILITAIVFFGFRASQPMIQSDLPGESDSTIQASTAQKESTIVELPEPDLKDLSDQVKESAASPDTKKADIEKNDTQ